MPRGRSGDGGGLRSHEGPGMNRDPAHELLPGFRWPVPRAFAAAVYTYRFEQGDVLYRDERAYDALAGGIPRGLTAIQVRLPTRSARSVPSDGEGDRRRSNWQSELELDLVDLARGAVEARTTTQGRLFMALWKGDDSGLDGRGEEPALPRSARELAQLLRDGGLVLPELAAVVHGSRFSFVVDWSADASRTKAALIADALQRVGACTSRDRFPAQLEAPDADRFHPTLVVRSVDVQNAMPGAVEEALRRALYGGPGESDRFSASRHGLLEHTAIDRAG